MAWWLKALISLPQDLNSVSSTHMAAHNPIYNSNSGEVEAFSDLQKPIKCYTDT